MLFHPGHLLGWLAFGLVLGSWQVPFLLAADWKDVKAVWSEGSTFGSRFHFSSPAAFAAHYAGYPLEVLGCMLPWSLMLLVFAKRQVRETLGASRPYTQFLLVACLVAFPTCWLPTDSRPRYFMSLYPCVAVLTGLACQKSWEFASATEGQNAWRRFLGFNSWLMFAVAALVAVAFCVPTALFDWFQQGAAFTAAFVVVSCALAMVARWARGGTEPARLRVGVLVVACFTGLTFTGLWMNALIKTSNQTAAQVADLKHRLGADAHLVSFGQIHHLFAYYYHEPIAYCPWPIDADGNSLPGDNDYFCFDQSEERPSRKLPFAWEPVAVVSCDRMWRETPKDAVVIGRRISQQARRPNITTKAE
jgi:hypothetical protein